MYRQVRLDGLRSGLSGSTQLRVGRPQGSRRTLQEPDAQLRLELRHAVARGLLGHPERPRRAREAPLAHHGGEHQHVGRLRHRPVITDGMSREERL
jgi:hypothetical protein